MNPDYAALPTEQFNPNTADIDRIGLEAATSKIIRETADFSKIIEPALPFIAKGAKVLAGCFISGGNIVFAGAGTSGRLGVIEAAECTPTFGIDKERLVYLMAGGKDAVFASQEGAEDDAIAANKEAAAKISGKDCVTGICASGVTPYVGEVLKVAKAKGAKTILVTCNKNTIFEGTDVVIAVDSGPEVISGSTRMKAGTATKIILNALTTAAMIEAGKIYKNFMADVQPTCKKLVARAIKITALLANISQDEAKTYLDKSGWKVKEAVVMAVKNVSLTKAQELLKTHKGFLKDIIE